MVVFTEGVGERDRVDGGGCFGIIIVLDCSAYPILLLKRSSLTPRCRTDNLEKHVKNI